MHNCSIKVLHKMTSYIDKVEVLWTLNKFVHIELLRGKTIIINLSPLYYFINSCFLRSSFLLCLPFILQIITVRSSLIFSPGFFHQPFLFSCSFPFCWPISFLFSSFLSFHHSTPFYILRFILIYAFILSSVFICFPVH